MVKYQHLKHHQRFLKHHNQKMSFSYVQLCASLCDVQNSIKTKYKAKNGNLLKFNGTNLLNYY